MIFFRTIAVCIPAVLLLSQPAVAGPRWTYLEANFYQTDAAADESDNMGFGAAGSLGFAGIWHTGVSYLDADAEVSAGSDFDYDGFKIFLGAHPHINENTDLVVDLVLVSYEGHFSRVAGTVEFPGVGFRTGVRSMITEKLELNAIGGWLRGDVKDTITGVPSQDYSEIGVAFGGQYNFTNAIGLGVVYALNDPIATLVSNAVSMNCSNCDSLTINLRWNFGDIL